MDLIKCPQCGELYASSYKCCPFCEEDWDADRKVKYRPKRHIADRQKAQSARGALIVVLVLVLALLSWYLFGDNIIHRDSDKSKTEGTDTEQTTPDQEPDDSSVPAINTNDDPFMESPPDGASGDQTGEGGEEAASEAAEANVDVSKAKLNKEDFTLSQAGEKYTIRLSGTEATPRWSIDNGNVASISPDGTVTAIANGNTTVHCQVGGRDLTCVVRVRNTGKNAEPADAPTVAEPAAPIAPAAPPAPTATTPDTPTANAASPSTQGTPVPSSNTHVDASSLDVKTNHGSLPKDPGTGYPDCTVRIGGDPITLKVIGTDVPVSSWMSDKTSVVTVDGSGNLTPVSVGAAYVTATVGDAKITCIIRVR